MQVTLGGDRLGSGNKNKIALRNYERSTHNLSQRFTSSMQCGVLYPFLVEPALRGDTFDIDLAADGRTIPTKGPLFGSFKMQVDLFQCPIRLYQAILHNNPTAIGLKMNQVFLPKLVLPGGDGTFEQTKMNNTSLMKYLGLSGIGTKEVTEVANAKFIRRVLAVPALAYYDIFKTYYANKQEENAYVISAKTVSAKTILITSYYDKELNAPQTYVNVEADAIGKNWDDILTITMSFATAGEKPHNIFSNKRLIKCNTATNDEDNDEQFSIDDLESFCKTYMEDKDQPKITEYLDEGLYTIKIEATYNAWNSAASYWGEYGSEVAGDYHYIKIPAGVYIPSYMLDNQLIPFKLKNIDDMRMDLLSQHSLGTAFKIGLENNQGQWDEASGADHTGLPYATLFKNDTHNIPLNTHSLNGLVVKTYQSDLFNNWVNTEWIDGENGIAAVTAISTSSGSFKIDSLNLAEKLYNMLNRIAVADGTYEGWQDAVYTQSPKRHIESPVYLGGMSSEIVFEEIVQSAPAEGNPLGTLAGKGRILKRKGGHVTVKVDEASFIIGIVSLTPRINYTQGNAWYLTELYTMDDFHKPALDGIGFENLIGERLAWWDTKLTKDSLTIERSTVGKVPAWINYMTAVDKGFGDFAAPDGNGFMLLQRNYERTTDEYIKDVTTYIDPRKYNYAFAYTELDAQNFWVAIQSNITARRLMSAKQIPNI